MKALINHKGIVIMVFVIVISFFLFKKEVEGVSYPLCKKISDDFCLLLANLQNDIKEDCPTGQCVYGVNDDGSLKCTACSGGGLGSSYWTVEDGWMFPNTTAGGQNNINITVLNASDVNTNNVNTNNVNANSLNSSNGSFTNNVIIEENLTAGSTTLILK